MKLESALLTALMFLASCASEPRTPPSAYHCAADGRNDILYLYDSVAVLRYRHETLSGKPTQGCEVVLAHWSGKPEYAFLTGDELDRRLVVDVEAIGYIKDKQLVMGFGEDYAEFDRRCREGARYMEFLENELSSGRKVEEGMYMKIWESHAQPKWFSLSEKKATFYATREDFAREVASRWGITNLFLEPVDAFFQKNVNVIVSERDRSVSKSRDSRAMVRGEYRVR